MSIRTCFRHQPKASIPRRGHRCSDGALVMPRFSPFLKLIFLLLNSNRNMVSDEDIKTVTQSDLELKFSQTYRMRFIKGTGELVYRVGELEEGEREREAEVDRKRVERWRALQEGRLSALSTTTVFQPMEGVEIA
jgi:hypothetical protein